jgi:hypothetical protein
MGKAIVGDEVGARYGELTVMSRSWLGPVANGNRRKRKVTVRCDCGHEYVINFYALGVQLRCRHHGTVKHGQSYEPIYRSWYNMKTRSGPNYTIGHYAGVGRDPRWDKFANFFEDMGDSWFPGAVISRIGDEGDYSKDNCRWITKAENAREATETRTRRRKQATN